MNPSKTESFFVYPDGRMKPDAAAAYTGISEKTLAAWRTKGVGPSFCKLGSRIFYRRDDLDRWIAERSGMISSGQARALETKRRSRGGS